MQRSKVDFPEPLGPSTTTTSPLSTSKLSVLRTSIDPYDLRRSLISTIAMAQQSSNGQLTTVSPTNAQVETAGNRLRSKLPLRPGRSERRRAYARPPLAPH